jgi:hypothetical protein
VSPLCSAPRVTSEDDRPTLAATLADFELEALVSLESVLGIPEDHNVEGQPELPLNRDMGVEDVADSPGWDFAPLLSNLLERDIDLVAGVSVFPVAHCVNVVTCDDNGRLERAVAAAVYEDEDSVACIPLGRPLDERFLGRMEQCSPAQRVRLLTEFVRIFRELVSVGGLGESLLGDAVCRLRELVRFLRVALCEIRTMISSESDDAARDRGQARNDDADPLHSSSPSVAGSGADRSDADNSTVGDVAGVRSPLGTSAAPSGGVA